MRVPTQPLFHSHLIILKG